MGEYKLTIATSAQREFDQDISYPAKRELNHKVVALKKNPRPKTSIHDPRSGFYAVSSLGWAAYYAVDDSTRTVTVLRYVRLTKPERP